MGSLKDNSTICVELVRIRGDGSGGSTKGPKKRTSFELPRKEAENIEQYILDHEREHNSALSSVDTVIFDIQQTQLVAEIIGKDSAGKSIAPVTFKGRDAESLAHVIVLCAREILRAR